MNYINWVYIVWGSMGNFTDAARIIRVFWPTLISQKILRNQKKVYIQCIVFNNICKNSKHLF